VFGWVDPSTGDHRRYELPNRAAIAASFAHELVKPPAILPINIEFDWERG